jgi:hypothetical protein
MRRASAIGSAFTFVALSIVSYACVNSVDRADEKNAGIVKAHEDENARMDAHRHAIDGGNWAQAVGADNLDIKSDGGMR